MNTAARWITALLLGYLSIAPIRHGGHERLAGTVEMLGAIVFVIPRAWRIGGILLLVVIAVVFTVHSIGGHPPLLLVFPALVITMLLVPR